MFSSNTRQVAPLPSRPAIRTPEVCIVDPNADDFQSWHSAAQTGRIRLHSVATAEEALRIARTSAIDLWVVNTTLPGLSGHELCGLVNEHSPRTPVYMVADDYSADAEQAAWAARASMFGTKPAHIAWLDQWLQLRREQAAPCRASALSGQHSF